jgi:hypothetical protein
MPRKNKPNPPIGLRLGDNITKRVEQFAIPRSIPVHTALRILLADALERIEAGHIPDLRDPMRVA